MRQKQALAVAGLVAASCAMGMACGAFGGADSKGGGGGGEDASAGDGEVVSDGAADVMGSSDGGAQKDTGAQDAGCASFVIPAVADTYLVDDNNHCNGFMTFGNATTLRAQVSSPAEYALVRFAISAAQLALLDSTAKITVSTSGATCSGGVCDGNAYAARSDWAEASGDSKGADLCRRDFPSFGWTAGLGAPIAQPADYDTAPIAAMSLSGSTWRSAPLPSATLNGRLAGNAAAGYTVTLLFKVTSPAGELVFPAHDADGGMSMTVTRCQ